MEGPDHTIVGRVVKHWRQVLVVGNCTVDISFLIPRFPLPGETLLASERRVDLGGKGANQAIVALRAGIATTLAVPLGQDGDGDWAARRLVDEGLPEEAFLRTPTATDQSILYIVPGGENCIVSSHAAAAHANPSWARLIVESFSPDGILLMQGNLDLETTAATLLAARKRGLTTVLNPAPIQYDYTTLFPLTDILIANAVECAEIGKNPDPVGAARSMIEQGAGQILVTLGARGALVIGRDTELSVAAPVVHAIDTVGAGDVFCGTFVACIARDAELHAAVMTAVEAAALSVTRRGTLASFPTAAESVANLERHGYL